MSRVAWLRVALLVGMLLALEAACRGGLIARFTMIPPSEAAIALVDLLSRGEGWADVGRTLRIIATCLAAAVALGLLLGIALHLLPRLRRAAEPLLTSYYAVPVFVLYPTFIMLFGANDVPLIIIGALFAVIVMAVNTLTGLQRVPLVLLKVARMQGLGTLETVWQVMLPATAPFLVTGVKLALAYAFIGVIAGEFILSTAGIGHAIAYAYNDFDNRTMYALLLLIVGLAITLNLGLHAWEQRLLRRLGKA